jgi:16S rRNA (guanine527-N7)-methyltransferase
MSARRPRRANVLPPEFGPAEFAAASGVSRETLARLKAFVGLLTDWNARHNLVSHASLADVWRRHMWDSAQLAPLLPTASFSLVDLGSGAGFPGLVLAILLREQHCRVVLYEATRKKAEFLAAVASATDTPVEIRNVRIEAAATEPLDVVTARACAPLDKLLGYVEPFQTAHTTNLFLKGQNAAAELTEAHKSWRMTAHRHQSQTDPSGVILEIRDLARVR